MFFSGADDVIQNHLVSSSHGVTPQSSNPKVPGNFLIGDRKLSGSLEGLNSSLALSIGNGQSPSKPIELERTLS